MDALAGKERKLSDDGLDIVDEQMLEGEDGETLVVQRLELGWYSIAVRKGDGRGKLQNDILIGACEARWLRRTLRRMARHARRGARRGS